MSKGVREYAVEVARREASVEIAMEEATVGDHQASGASGSAVKSAQGQFRVLKDALESGISYRVESGRRAAPWMAMHAATVINKGRKDDEAFTVHKKMERERAHQASGRVWRMRDALAGGVR